MSEIIRKEHNISTLMYHTLCPARYRRAVINEEVDKKTMEICLGIETRYEIRFLEIGTEPDHVHFLVQSVPTYSPEQIVRTIKSITAKKIYEAWLEVKRCYGEGSFGHEDIMWGQWENMEVRR
jgi:REP element-mobilizing transposase RayT